MASARINEYINSLSVGSLFTSRNLVKFGKRPAVDQTVYRLVKSKKITRITPGVFIKPFPGMKKPTPEEVAKVKAESFGREIRPFAGVVARKIGLKRKTSSGSLVFAINGHTSSFRIGNKRIHFKGICQRKFRLMASRTGEVLAALWYQRPLNCDIDTIQHAFRKLTTHEQRQQEPLAMFLPAWLRDLLLARQE